MNAYKARQNCWLPRRWRLRTFARSGEPLAYDRGTRGAIVRLLQAVRERGELLVEMQTSRDGACWFPHMNLLSDDPLLGGKAKPIKAPRSLDARHGRRERSLYDLLPDRRVMSPLDELILREELALAGVARP